ncbi:sugar transferase [Alphaproteobacteria bacterium LSUCC0396]
MYSCCLKRGLDIAFGLFALMISLPLFLIIGFLIKNLDGGPIFFVSMRVGKDGRVFSFYKFRSMPVNTAVVASDKLGEVSLSWLGSFLRRTNLDELPQFWNILIGDMSLVGPRPSLVTQVELIEKRRSVGALKCRPGLTGLAQVNSFDGMSIDEKSEFDGIYAKNISAWNDLKIVLSTFKYLSKPPPVY